jgi:two-component system, OmpR family, sensor histidine kinase QseC
MTQSIRTFLLINLLLSVILITSLAIIGNLFLTHKDIQTNLDSDLIVRALQIQALTTHRDGIITDPDNIQKKLAEISPSKIQEHIAKASNPEAKKAYATNNIEFQIWNNKGEIVLHSQGAPKHSLEGPKTGFQDSKSKNHTWRTYTLTSTKTPLTVVTAEHGRHRKQLENQLTQDSIFIMVLTYPLLGFLIWIIIGRGLQPLQMVTKELKHRDKNYLESVDLKNIPKEIEPLTDELNNLFYRLKEAFDRHERFTSDAAHELRTPLAALSAQIQVALRANTTESRNSALLKVLGGVNRCTHLVQQLLTISRMAPEAGIQNPVRVKLASQASDIAAMLVPDAIAKNTEIELISHDSKAEIIGNPTAISILMRNLLDNAIRYSPEKSLITIEILEDHDKGKVILQVSDNGPGIPKELRERVFERFYRMIGNKASGTGLGLGIVLQIIKLHKADIELLKPKEHDGLIVKISFAAIPKD